MVILFPTAVVPKGAQCHTDTGVAAPLYVLVLYTFGQSFTFFSFLFPVSVTASLFKTVVILLMAVD